MGKKGKANGRAGQKKKAQRTSGYQQPQKSTPRSRAAQLWADDDEDYEDIPRSFQGFAQASARTPHRMDFSVKLRHQKISFVSAGSNTPAEVEEEGTVEHTEATLNGDDDDDDIQINVTTESELAVPQSAMAGMVLESPPSRTPSTSLNPNPTHFAPVNENAKPSTSLRREKHLNGNILQDPAQVDFVIDTEGDATLSNGYSKKNGKAPVVRSPSPAASSSGSEKIVFQGRHPRNKPGVTWTEISNYEYKRATGEPSPFDPKSPQEETWKPASPDRDWEKKRQPVQNDFSKVFAPQLQEKGDPYGSQYIQRLRNEERVQKDARKVNRRGKKGRKNDIRRPAKIDSESDGMSEAAYDDYMQNLAAQLDEDEEIATMPNVEFTNDASMVVDGKVIGDDEVLDRNLKDDTDMDWTTSEQVGISSSEDEENFDRKQRLHEREQLEKLQRRQRRQQRKYLDNTEGAENDDNLRPSSDEYDSSTMDSSELEDALDYTEQEQWEDEQDLRDRAMERKSDEQVAKLWAKQIALGIDADELIIDDGLYDADDGIGDVAAARQGLDATLPARSSKRKSKGFTFPNASALADSIDQYGEAGFDIMDFDRPSLRQPKKGRKGKLPPEVEGMSDESLKEELANQWENDRRKKSLKKQEREELRAEGLLGTSGRKGVADLSQKYRDGMTTAQIKVELADFIQRPELNARAFPPMAKGDRKTLHEIASALKLNSKSMGSGKKRFPILTKTWATPDYDERGFDQIFIKASRGQLKILGNANKFKERSGPRNSKAARGGFDRSAGLKNGEIVGAGAPEIGQDTFGHRMMEKMGWTKGTALGKDGEGRLDPVEQVMRTGKAGLG